MITPLLNRRRLMMANTKEIVPNSNEIWLYPTEQTMDSSRIPNNTLISSKIQRSLKVLVYENPILTCARLTLLYPSTPSIIVFPEGFQSQSVIQEWIQQNITHLYIPSTFIYDGQRNFKCRSGFYLYNVWLAWSEPPTYRPYSGGIDTILYYHVLPGLKADYIAAGWPEEKIKDDYEFNPWKYI